MNEENLYQMLWIDRADAGWLNTSTYFTVTRMLFKPTTTCVFALVLCLVLPVLPGLSVAQVPLSPAGASENSGQSTQSLHKSAVRAVITSWASAWQSQMDSIYLLHYHPDFEPEGFASKAQWQAQRQARIMDPERIDISLRGLEFLELTETQAQVRFWLKYSRPGYADETRKQMLLVYHEGAWQIRTEENLEVRRL